MKRLKQIEDDLSSLRSSLNTSKEKEYKQKVLRYVKKAFQDFSQVDVPAKIDCMDRLDYCSKRVLCKNLMRSQAEAAGVAYMRNDLERSNKILDALKERVGDMAEDCETPDCRNYTLSLISDIKTVLVLAKRIENNSKEAGTEVEKRFDHLRNTADASDALSAFAHPARLDILISLENHDLGFSELSNELHLRTGHLQYHLKILEDNGYVRRDHKGGRYGITIKGLTALEGLRDLMFNVVSADLT
jgi:DNA-binding transcriptional ArsR family regulator